MGGRRLLRDARTWLLLALLVGGSGLLCGLFGMLLVGMGVSGSGCGRQCIDNVMLFSRIGMLLLGLGMAAALTALVLLWSLQRHSLRLWLRLLLSLLALLMLLVGGASFSLLVSL
jgi:hypothetical protein